MNARTLKVPHTFVLLLCLIALAAAGSYLVPAGEFDRVRDPGTNRTVVVPGTYHRVPPNPVGLFAAVTAFQRGSVDAAEIIFFVFFVYASFYVVLGTGALHAFIGWLLRTLRGRAGILLPASMYLFSLGGAVFGMFEETFGFIPLFIGLATALGYDALVGVSAVSLAVGVGFSAAFLNPFTVGVAQHLAELPPFSGLGFRAAAWFVFTTLAVIYTMAYARRVRRDPARSILAGTDLGTLALDREELLRKEFTGRDGRILLGVAGAIGLLVWGVISRGWGFGHIAGLFLVLGSVSGLLAGWNPSRIASTFVEGARDIVFGALVIGLSRGILVVLREARIIDTIVQALAAPLSYLPRWLAAEGMLVVQTLVNFFIPSGPGQAATTIPVLAPLSDLLGISRQTAVLAFQFGDGFSNLLWPTTALPVICSVARVPIEKWWRFFLPFFGWLLLAQAAFIAIAVAVNLQ